MSIIKYRPEIDGLRAVAIIPVVLFHLEFSWIAGGYFGVDIFFVISGFLITSILLKEENSHSFSLKKFWLRRLRRIMPALLFMVAIVLLLCHLLLFRPVLKEYYNDALSSIFSYANISMYWKFGDYWGAAAENSPFLHCWSLSVEEQFYLIYPLIVAFFLSNRTRLLIVLLIIAVLSFITFLFATVYYPTAGFYLLPSRAWELACGGILAAGGRPFLKFKNIFSFTGIFLILLSFFVLTGSKGISLFAILPVLGAIFIIGYSTSTNFVGRILSSSPMVQIGKISYSLYLWHWPIIVISKLTPARLYLNEHIFILIQIGLMILFSIISYRYIEQTTKNIKPILWIVGIGVVICLTEISLFKSFLFKSEYNSFFDPLHTYTRYYQIAPINDNKNIILSDKYKGTIAPRGESHFKEAAFNNGILKGNQSETPKIVVLGDSHGSAMSKILDELGNELHYTRSFFTMSGNNPLFSIPLKNNLPTRKSFTESQFRIYAQNLVNKLLLWKPKLLIISCKWDNMNNEYENLESLVNFSAQNNITVLFINQPPIIYSMGDNNSAQYFSYLGYKPNKSEQFIPLLNTKPVDEANTKLAMFVHKHNNCRIVDINDNFQKNEQALIIKNKSVLYFDDDHLSYEGSLLVKDEISIAIKSILKSH